MRPVPSLTTVVELLTPTIVVVALYLLVSGHDRPGGGFVAGLMLATVPVIRHAAALPVPGSARGPLLLGLGVVTATVVTAAGLVEGAPLTQYDATVDAPLFGAVKLTTIVVFDVGVAAVVVGLVLTMLDHLDRDPTRRGPREVA